MAGAGRSRKHGGHRQDNYVAEVGQQPRLEMATSITCTKSVPIEKASFCYEQWSGFRTD